MNKMQIEDLDERELQHVNTMLAIIDYYANWEGKAERYYIGSDND
jgi:hypothetical protein